MPPLSPLPACTECGMPLEELDFYLDGRPVCPTCWSYPPEHPGTPFADRPTWHEPYEETGASCCKCGEATYIETSQRVYCDECATAVPAPPRSDEPLSPLNPRPFCQMARRYYRMGVPIPVGYLHAVSAAPCLYVQRRRRAAVAASLHTLRRAHNRRANRRYVQFVAALRLRFPCEVA